MELYIEELEKERNDLLKVKARIDMQPEVDESFVSGQLLKNGARITKTAKSTVT